jgi:sacsin
MFGLGFNSVYHLTDAPQFVSGEFHVVLDPMKVYYPGLHPNDSKAPGSMNRFVREPNFKQLRDQFAPFQAPCFGCDLTTQQPYDGTLFRFPLRTEAQAQRAGQRGIGPAYPMEKVARQFEQFQRTADEKLLFFQHVRSIELWEWCDGESEPRQLYSATMCGADRGERASLSDWLKSSLDRWEQKSGQEWKTTPGSTMAMLRTVDPSSVPRNTWKMVINIKDFARGQEREEHWWQRAGIGREEAWQAATKDDRDGALTLWPAAAIAVRVHSHCAQGEPPRKFAGKAFATLPTQMKTGYPAHINARWRLSNNRASLKSGDALSEKVEVLWNRALIRDTIAHLWAELLVELRHQTPPLPTSVYYSLWPKRSLDGMEEGVQPSSEWDHVIDPIYRVLSAHDVLRVRDAGFSLSLHSQHCPDVGKWTSINDGGVWDMMVEVPSTDAKLKIRSAW